MSVRPAKTQISLGIHPVWSESLLFTQWVAKNPSFLHADSEDSDQTGQMPRLIWVFAGRTVILLVLSCRGSYDTEHNMKENTLYQYTCSVTSSADNSKFFTWSEQKGQVTQTIYLQGQVKSAVRWQK